MQYVQLYVPSSIGQCIWCAFRPLALQPRIQPSSVRFKADHLVQQHFFFSVYAEGDARMHAHFSNIHRVQPYKRATTPMHSAPIPGVHIHYGQHKLDLGLSRTTQPTMSRSSRSQLRSAAHIRAQPPCSTDIMSMMQHVKRGSRSHWYFHTTVGTIVPWTVLHITKSVRSSLGQYCTT
jgi:hypothetical protein